MMSNFEEITEEMRRHRMKLPGEKVQIKIGNAKQILNEAMAHFLSQEGRNLQWLPEYSKVCNWLTDNKGKGLLLYGDCGRGKSYLCRYVLPAILLKHSKRVVSVFDIHDMNADIDYVLSKHIISLDDIGTEQQSVKYGERRMAFSEIMDAAEKDGKLFIISTNLSAGGIKSRYGIRTLDRIRSVTSQILFEGESLRR